MLVHSRLSNQALTERSGQQRRLCIFCAQQLCGKLPAWLGISAYGKNNAQQDASLTHQSHVAWKDVLACRVSLCLEHYEDHSSNGKHASDDNKDP